MNRNRVYSVRNGRYNAEPAIIVDLITSNQQGAPGSMMFKDYNGEQDWWTNMNSNGDWKASNYIARKSPFFKTYQQIDKKMDMYGFAQHTEKIHPRTKFYPTTSIEGG